MARPVRLMHSDPSLTFYQRKSSQTDVTWLNLHYLIMMLIRDQDFVCGHEEGVFHLNIETQGVFF